MKEQRKNTTLEFEKLQRAVDQVIQRDDPIWKTPSGALLDLLRQFAREEKIPEIATSCELYFARCPENRDYVEARLPAIIINNYGPLARVCQSSAASFLATREQRLGEEHSRKGIFTRIDKRCGQYRKFAP